MIYTTDYYLQEQGHNDHNGSTKAYLWAKVTINQQEEIIRWILSFAISLMAKLLNLNSIDY